jgi:amidophosphoribosyltransferase
MGATHEEMRANVAADALVFQDLKALKAAIAGANPALRDLEISCFG